MKDIVFFSHSPQIQWYALLAEDLADLLGVRSTLWVLGDEARNEGEETGGFHRVVDLLEGFDGRESEQQAAQAFERLRQLEEASGEAWYQRDVAQDRWLEARRWSDDRIAQFSAHLLDAIDAELDELDVYAAFGETNFLAYRLAYRRIRSAAPFMNLVIPRLDGRFLLEDRLDWGWDRCQEAYRQFSAEGIPEPQRQAAEEIWDSIVNRQASPEYHKRTPRGPESVWKKLYPARALESFRLVFRGDWRESVRNPRIPGLWQSLPPYKLARAVGWHLRTRLFDRMAISQIPQQRPFVCYFLSMQPEYTVEGLALEYRDQAAMARNIAAALPADVKLLVKEHRPMVGRRALSFHREIAATPNVRLVSDQVGFADLLQHARAAITLTGSVALEALCFGVPSVVLGRGIYSARTGAEFAGIYTPHHLQELPEVLARAVAPGAAGTREDAIRLLAAMLAGSHPGMLAEVYSLDEQRDPENRTRMAEGIHREVELWYQRHRPAETEAEATGQPKPRPARAAG